MLKNINIRDGSNKLWKTAKIVKNQIKHTPPLKIDGQSLLNDIEKANALSNQFFKAHEITQNYAVIDNEFANSIQYQKIVNQIKLILKY